MVYYKQKEQFKNIKGVYKWIWEVEIFFHNRKNSSTNVGATYGLFLEKIRKSV